MDRSPVTHARLRPDRARLYPAIDKERWFPIVSQDSLGVMVDLGNRKLFMFAGDVELRHSPPLDAGENETGER